ncbi:MAG: SH3 domain-containing protein [Maritimibacter sp.]
MFSKTILTSSLVLSLSSFAAFAQSLPAAPGDLNLYAGPGKGFTVLEVIPANAPLNLKGCLPTGDWCAVSMPIEDGWIYSPAAASKTKVLTAPEFGPAD